MTPALAWQLPRRPDLGAELAAACARFRERTGKAAARLEVHPGEIVDGGGLVVLESRAVARGCWLVGCGE